MNNEQKNNEERLFDLLETTGFESLTQQDCVFVLSQMTEEEYRFQQRVFSEAGKTFTEDLVPRALVIPQQKGRGKTRVIPLYQAVIAVAAVILFFILIWPQNSDTSLNKLQAVERKRQMPLPVKPMVIHDTLVRVVERIKYVEKVREIKGQENELKTGYFVPQEPLLQREEIDVASQFREQQIESKGTSLKDENESRFILVMKN